MKKVFIILATLFVASSSIFGQQDCPEVKELEKWENIDAIFPQEFPVSDLQCDGATIFVNLLKGISDEEFEKWCKTPINMDELRKRYPNADFQIMISCSNSNEKKSLMAYMKIIDGTIKPVIPKQTEEITIQREKLEKELVKIQNTRKYYADLIAALDKEIKFNQIEVVDNAIGLLKKTIPMNGETSKIFDIITDDAMREWRSKEEVEKSNIKNTAADVVNGIVETVDKGLKIMKVANVPTDKINVGISANRVGMYWSIFKVLPELGKGLAHSGAALTIYFQKQEYKKMIEQLDKQEQKIQELL